MLFKTQKENYKYFSPIHERNSAIHQMDKKFQLLIFCKKELYSYRVKILYDDRFLDLKTKRKFDWEDIKKELNSEYGSYSWSLRYIS